MRLRNADLVELATQVRDVKSVGPLEVVLEGGDALGTFRRFVAVLTITRGLAQER